MPQDIDKRIWIANDHGGYLLKRDFLKYFEEHGVDYHDLGTGSEDIVRYPYYAAELARAVSQGRVERGILICSTGIGMSIMANRYKGVGGHVERDEDVRTAALREISEETGWRAEDIQDLRLRGIVNVDAGDPFAGIMIFCFTARALRRATHASEEGTLEWVPRSELLNYPLVEDLPILLPRLLSLPENAPLLFAHYSYDEQDELVVHFG